MDNLTNPFQQFYFSDDTQTEKSFVSLFSNKVLQTAIHPVFQGGNVVLSGTQGCGKTMILSLLRPETRIAYFEQGKEFPVISQLRNFISAGVNLTRSRLTDLVQITLNEENEIDEQDLPLYFADFFNYWVVGDLIKSVEKIGQYPDIFSAIVNLSNIDECVKSISKQDCWFGALDGVNTIDELKKQITNRINVYRRWVNGNIIDKNDICNIRQTKTNIGEPIARFAECLRQCGISSEDVPILIRIDQIEELHKAFTVRQHALLLSFRKIINRVFAARDARVHYRAGTRQSGWTNPDFLRIWGSEACLEDLRDYKFIDMDKELFILNETKNSIFSKFCLEAFQKRITYCFNIDDKNVKPDMAKSIFGKSPISEERLAQLNKNPEDVQIDRILGLDLAADNGTWSLEWRIFLRTLFRTGNGGMLNAVLAAAWGRQTGGARFKEQHRELPPPSNAPWQDRKWWRKERLDQAVLQLSTRSQQRFMWWGYDDICSLSGGNITVFILICHRIWDGFLKMESSLSESKRIDLLKDGTIPRDIQAAGILFASNEWFNKLPEEPGGNTRKYFIEKLGIRLNDEMMQDLRMAYPGGNGISITRTEFYAESDDIKDLRNFIIEAVSYGALTMIEHSSKIKLAGKRIKLYLNPILCPRFQLPEARTKEPYYWKIEELYTLAKKANVTLSFRKSQKSHPLKELPLFANLEDQQS